MRITARAEWLGSTQLVNEALNALIATLESVVGNQILPDCRGIAIPTQTQLDDFPVGFTGTGRANRLWSFLASWPLNPTPKPVITALAGFEIAFAFPFVERFSGLGLGLTADRVAGFAASDPVITLVGRFCLPSRPHLPGGHTPIPAAFR